MAKETILTKEYFDKGLQGVKDHVTKEVEGLARMTANGFDEVYRRLDKNDEIGMLKRRMDRIEKALHVT